MPSVGNLQGNRPGAQCWNSGEGLMASVLKHQLQEGRDFLLPLYSQQLEEARHTIGTQLLFVE